MSVATLNCFGLENNIIYIQKIIEQNQIVFLQETWLDSLNSLDQKINKYNTYKTFHRSAMTSKVRKGRPYGGIGWIISKSIKNIFCIFSSERITYIKIDNLVIIGVYMHFNDGKTETALNFENDLSIISTIYNKYNKENEILIIGDFNTDLNKNNEFVRLLNNFMNLNKVKCMDLMFLQKYDNTYKKGLNKSWIDHVIASENNVINQINIEECEWNYGDHNALIININLFKKNEENLRIDCPNKKLRLNWNDPEFTNKYNQNFNEKLFNLNEKINGILISNNKETLKDKLSNLINEIHSLMINSANETHNKLTSINSNGHVKKNRWWNYEIDFLHKQYKNAKKIYKQSDYKCIHARKEVKKCKNNFRVQKRNNERLIKEKQFFKLKNVFNTDRIQFWKEVNKIKNKKVKINVQINELKNEFYKQFNTKIFKNSETTKLAEENFKEFTLDNKKRVFDEYKVDLKVLENIIKGLSNGKSKGFAEVQPEMYKYAMSVNFQFTVGLILETMIKYGIIPYLFNIGIIKPIIKDEKKDTNNVNNLRPVTVSDTLANIYEKLILSEIEKFHINNEKQFGFKKASSCNHAIFVVNETIKFNTKKNKKTFICTIDASKAFDKVDRKYLWLKLKEKLKPHILNSLINYYKNSMAIIQNGEEYSEIFETTIGVKQGGPLSPRLFAIYIEDLIDEIGKSGKGIKFGDIRIDVILYADDILLISDNLQALQSLLDITEDYGRKWEIKFNPEKTVFMEFGSQSKFLIRNSNLKFDQKEIKKVEKMKYLGCHYNNKLNNKDHLNKKRFATFSAVNKIKDLGIESINISTAMKSCLYKTYCRPVLFYGIENLVLSELEKKKLQTIEANIIKRSYGLSHRVRSTDLIYSVGLERSIRKIERLKLNFLKRICTNTFTDKFIRILAKKFRASPRNVNKKSILYECKCITGANEFEIDKILQKGNEKLKFIDRETESIINSEKVIKIKSILMKESSLRTEELKIELNAF